MRSNIFLASFIASTVSLFGCGGAASSSPLTGGGSTSQRVGQASVTFSGKATPAIGQGNNSVTVNGMSGAVFSSITLVPNQNVDNTSIVYTGFGGAPMTVVGMDGSATPITNTSLFGLYGTFTHNGHLLFGAYIPSDNSTDGIYYCNYDGSSATRIGSIACYPFNGMDWSPNNSKIAYVDGSNLYLYVANANGTSPILISKTGIDPAFSPDSSTIAYSDLPTSSSKYQVYTQPVAGGTPKLFCAGLSSTVGYRHPSWSPDGKTLLVTADDGSSNRSLQICDSQHLLLKVIQPSGISNDSQGSFSPDGNSIVFTRQASYSSNETPAQIYTASYAGNLVTPIGNTIGQFPHWSPFLTNKSFVGTSGEMFPSAAGFLYGQVKDVFESFLSFTAKTPADATTTLESTAPQGEIVFDVHADAITGLKFTNSYYNQPTTVISGTSTSVTDALVSFGGNTGKVDTLAPFVATRGQLAPVRTAETVTYSGRFIGIWNASGKDLAPHGASQLVFSAKSGQLVSYR